MHLPPFGIKQNKQVQILHFGGLDMREKAPSGSLSQTENLCADAFPALIPRKPREKVITETGITAFCAPEYTEKPITAFTGIKDNHFYYQEKKISTTPLASGEKSIADFNGKLCIFPDKLFYSYLPDPETGAIADRLESMEKTLTLSGVSFYSSYHTVTGAYTAYLSKTNAGFDTFLPGENLVISGCSKEENNTRQLQGRKDYATNTAIVSAVVESATSSRLNLLLLNRRGERVTFANTTETNQITVKVAIPDINHVCVHNNRLWGTASNGEYIYASKLGACMNFFSFQGLQDDSWYGMLGTPGQFTGICSYRSAVVAMKRDCIHHVYGDAPQNFSYPNRSWADALTDAVLQSWAACCIFSLPPAFVPMQAASSTL